VDSSTAPQLGDAIEAITDTGRFRIILDFSEVDFISSAGLRVLINAQKNCKRYNRGEVILTAVPLNIFSALDLAGFTSLFTIKEDTLDAVGSF
jgi:anti-sigma B factor antagonist